MASPARAGTRVTIGWTPCDRSRHASGTCAVGRDNDAGECCLRAARVEFDGQSGADFTVGIACLSVAVDDGVGEIAPLGFPAGEMIGGDLQQ